MTRGPDSAGGASVRADSPGSLRTTGADTANATDDRPVVLIVDDNQALADMYAAQLDDEFEVRSAYDGDAALEAIDDTVDVVLLDRRMPGPSGDEVLETLRDRGYDCGVVMLTAVSMDFETVELAFDEYLVKPVTLAELKETILRMVTLGSAASGPKRYYALASKRYALEMRKATSDLRENEYYQELLAEIEELRTELDSEVATRLDAEASAAVFGSRGGETLSGPDLEELVADSVSSTESSPGELRDVAAGVADQVLAGREAAVLLDHVREPIFVVNGEGQLIDCNDAFTERFGYTGSDIEGELSSMLYADPTDPVTDDDGRLRTPPDTGRTEAARYQTKDGAVITGETTVVKLDDAARETVAYAAIVTEISDAEGEGVRPDSIPVNDLLGLRLLQHELGNELTLVSAMVGQLLEEASDEQQADLEEVLDVVSRIGDRLQTYGEYLASVRDAGELVTGEVDIVPVVEQVVDQYRQSADDATIVLGELEPATVRANDLLDVVIKNLIENAIDHHDAGQPTVEVDVERDGELVRLRVTDDGPGIPPAVRHAMKEPEQKGPESDGMGLGLYLVDQLVTAYGGSIRFEDREPAGTVAVVELPRVDWGHPE